MSSALQNPADTYSSSRAASSPVSAILDNPTSRKEEQPRAAGRSLSASVPPLSLSLSSTDLSLPSQNPSTRLPPLRSTSPPLPLHRGHPANEGRLATASGTAQMSSREGALPEAEADRRLRPRRVRAIPTIPQKTRMLERACGRMRYTAPLSVVRYLLSPSFQAFLAQALIFLLFLTALMLVPNMGARSVKVGKYTAGRNGLLAEYIRRQTGVPLDRKEVGLQIQKERLATNDPARTPVLPTPSSPLELTLLVLQVSLSFAVPASTSA
jgi:hypothetical protein